MIGNIYENGTGTWLAFGRRKTKQIEQYVDAGHIFVEGEPGDGPNWTKYEKGRVVPDTDRIAADRKREQDREKAKEDAKTGLKQLKAAVKDETTDFTDPDVVRAALSRVVDALKYLGRAIDE